MRKSRHVLSLCLAGAAVLLMSLAATAQAVPFQVLVKSGDPAPDGDGVYEGGTGINFGAPSINNLGQVLFRASLDNTSAGSDLVTTVTAGVLVEVAQQGTTPPFSSLQYGGLFLAGQGQASISDAGQPVFMARFSGDDAVVTGSGPTAVLVALEGDSALGDGTLTPSLGRNPSVNTAGQVAFHANLFNTTDGADAAIYLFNGAGPLVQIVRDGQSLPAALGAGTFVSQNFGSPALNSQGYVAFASEIEGSAISFDAGVFLSNGTDMVQIVRAGDALPVPGGGTFTDRLGFVALNDLNQVSFHDQPDTGQSGVFTGIFRGQAGTVTTIAFDGDELPGGDSLYGIGAANAINNAGQVVFRASTLARQAGSGAYAGVFVGDGLSITQIALMGQATPRGDGILVQAGSNDTFAINDQEQVAFLFGVDLTPDVVDPIEQGLFFYDEALGLFQIAQTGDELLGSTITDLSFLGTSTDGFAPDELTGLNNDGVVVFRYALENGNEGIATWAIPEPTTLTLMGLGLASLLRRRR